MSSYPHHGQDAVAAADEVLSLASQHRAKDGSPVQSRRSSGRKSPPRRESRVQRFEAVMEFIAANLASSLRVGDLAAHVNMSYGHFIKVFQCATGESPLAHLRRRRVERAQQMLLQPDLSLAEIALCCGFADQSHLTKSFRRLVGCTPAVRRRALLAGAGTARKNLPSLRR